MKDCPVVLRIMPMHNAHASHVRDRTHRAQSAAAAAASSSSSASSSLYLRDAPLEGELKVIGLGSRGISASGRLIGAGVCGVRERERRVAAAAPPKICVTLPSHLRT